MSVKLFSYNPLATVGLSKSVNLLSHSAQASEQVVRSSALFNFLLTKNPWRVVEISHQMSFVIAQMVPHTVDGELSFNIKQQHGNLSFDILDRDQENLSFPLFFRVVEESSASMEFNITKQAQINYGMSYSIAAGAGLSFHVIESREEHELSFILAQLRRNLVASFMSYKIVLTKPMTYLIAEGGDLHEMSFILSRAVKHIQRRQMSFVVAEGSLCSFSISPSTLCSYSIINAGMEGGEFEYDIVETWDEVDLPVRASYAGPGVFYPTGSDEFVIFVTTSDGTLIGTGTVVAEIDRSPCSIRLFVEDIPTFLGEMRIIVAHMGRVVMDETTTANIIWEGVYARESLYPEPDGS